MRGSRHFYEMGSNQNGKIISQTRGGGGSNPQKIQKIPFLGKIFIFQGRAPCGYVHDLDPFYGKVNFGNRGFYMGKSENDGFFKNDCSLRPEKW